jgi:hypothetical protein
VFKTILVWKGRPINKKISEPNKKLHAAYSKSPILGAFVK